MAGVPAVRTALLMLLAASSVEASTQNPFAVGSRAQLFVDQVLVRSSENIAFMPHPARKHPGNPLIKVDRPEMERIWLCGSAIFDEEERIFKMWYLSGNGTTYATSQDGLTWEKQDVLWRGYMFANVWKDRADPDPARRYKIIAWSPNAPGVLNTGYEPPIRTGYNTSVSADGKVVAPAHAQPICPKGDVIGGYYDRRLRLHVAFPKIGTDVNGFKRRCFYVATSTDFATWSEPKPVLVPDLRDDAGSLARAEEVRSILDAPLNLKQMRTEFYGIGVYQQESCTIAFPWLFTVTGSLKGMPQEGPGEIQLAVTRDLQQWERPFRIPAIPRGRAGEWDGGFFETAAEAFRVGDEIRLYYSASNRGHGQRQRKPEHTFGIGLVTWKLDRFVSADAPPEGGVLTTVPVAFTGSRLELNAVTKPGGQITVEILNLAGQTMAQSKPFAGDDLRARLEWMQAVDLAALAGTPVSLRFRLKNAELYSFAFRE